MLLLQEIKLGVRLLRLAGFSGVPFLSFVFFSVWAFPEASMELFRSCIVTKSVQAKVPANPYPSLLFRSGLISPNYDPLS